MIGLLSGCVSMLPHTRASDDQVVGMATGMALTVTCVEKGMTDPNIGYPFTTVATDLLSVSVYNETLYESTYRNRVEKFNRDLPSSLAVECDAVNREIPSLTLLFRERYARIAQARSDALRGIARDFANFQPGYTSYTYLPMPSGQVSFGQASNSERTHHYLVNTSTGQRQCSVTPSGYVNCM